MGQLARMAKLSARMFAQLNSGHYIVRGLQIVARMLDCMRSCLGPSVFMWACVNIYVWYTA